MQYTLKRKENGTWERERERERDYRERDYGENEQKELVGVSGVISRCVRHGSC
jgi:hypothetical protein